MEAIVPKGTFLWLEDYTIILPRYSTFLREANCFHWLGSLNLDVIPLFQEEMTLTPKGAGPILKAGGLHAIMQDRLEFQGYQR